MKNPGGIVVLLVRGTLINEEALLHKFGHQRETTDFIKTHCDTWESKVALTGQLWPVCSRQQQTACCFLGLQFH